MMRWMMENNGYCQPDTCIPGKIYLMKNYGSVKPDEYIAVKLLGYRPHPAEVVVLVGEKRKVVHRACILERNSRDVGSD